MRIAVLSQDDSRGGAAKVAQILAHGLAGRGHEVQFLVRHKHLEGDASVALEWPARRGKSKLKGKVLHRLGVNGLGFTCPFPKCMGAGFWRSFDIVHIHDFPEFNWSHFRWLCGLTNVVVTPHTLGWVTGNCLYSYDCDGFTRSCGNCPQFGKFPLLYYHRDGSRLNMWYKRHVTRRMRLGAVGPSGRFALADRLMLAGMSCFRDGSAQWGRRCMRLARLLFPGVAYPHRSVLLRGVAGVVGAVFVESVLNACRQWPPGRVV